MKKLILGFILALMFNGCTGPEPFDGSIFDFNYKNISDSDVTMIVHSHPTKSERFFIVKSGSIFSFSMNEDVEPSNPFNTFDSICDSVTIKYNEQKQKTYTLKDKDPRNPLFLKSYVKTEITYSHFVFDYTISIDNF